MQFSIGRFILEVTHNSIFIEAGGLFGMHAFCEHNGKPRWGIQWDHLIRGARGWTLRAGPIEVTGQVCWPSFLPQPHSAR